MKAAVIVKNRVEEEGGGLRRDNNLYKYNKIWYSKNAADGVSNMQIISISFSHLTIFNYVNLTKSS